MTTIKKFEIPRGQFLYTDGGVIGSNPSEIGGVWAYVLVVDDEIAKAGGDIFAPDMSTNWKTVTNNQAEMLAIIRGLQVLPEDWMGTVVSDSTVTLGRVFEDWKMKNIPPFMLTMLEKEQNRLWYWNKISHRHVKGHPTDRELAEGIGDKWNVYVDKLCQIIRRQYMSFHHQMVVEGFFSGSKTSNEQDTDYEVCDECHTSYPSSLPVCPVCFP